MRCPKCGTDSAGRVELQMDEGTMFAYFCINCNNEWDHTKAIDPAPISDLIEEIIEFADNQALDEMDITNENPNEWRKIWYSSRAFTLRRLLEYLSGDLKSLEEMERTEVKEE